MKKLSKHRRSFLVGAFPLRKKARLLQWVVFFSLQSHSEWSTFLTIFTILQVLQFLLSLRSSILTSSKKLNGAKGYSFGVFSALLDFFQKTISPKGSPFNFFDIFRQKGC